MVLGAGVRLYACDMLASGPGGAHAAEEWLDRYYGTADQRDDAVLRQRDGSPLTAWQAFIADTATRQVRFQADCAGFALTSAFASCNPDPPQLGCAARG